jgi:hypothetical protein
MRAVAFFSGFTLLAGCASGAAPAARNSDGSPADAFAVVAEADRLAERDLWPGFDPRAIPVAIHDGERTLLFRHPSPPAGFQRVAGRDGVWEYSGRYPGVTANSSAEIGGVVTATLMPATGGVSLLDRAGLLIHEAFHVFQRTHDVAAPANEVELFTYPADDAELLALRRLEGEALRRALAARPDEQAACWARTAMHVRGERFARLPAGAAGYERGTEGYEGLASYVERRATARADGDLVPGAGFAPDALRQRGYATGAALARLLDRFAPQWRTTPAPRDSADLDVRLAAALDASNTGDAACAFTPAERSRLQAAASADVETLRSRRVAERAAFLEQTGWRLVVEAAGAPLFPHGFDPLNVQRVEHDEVLHTRWLKLGNDAGVVEVLGHASLSKAAGEHPLFNGVRRLTVTGLAGEPAVTEANGVVTVQAPGITAQLRGATVERAGRTTTVRLVPAP